MKHFFTVSRIIFTSCCILLCASCSSGFNRNLVAANMEKSGVQITSEEILHLQSIKPQLPSPFSLGVWANGDLRFRRQIRTELQPIAEKLQRDRVITDVVFIGNDPGNTRDREIIRQQAVAYGVDAVLVIDEEHQVDSYVNPLSILYLTLIGTVIFPGSHHDVLSEVRGVIIDSNNGFLYAVATGDGEARSMRPEALIDEKEIHREAISEAIKNFSPELESRVRNLALEAAKLSANGR